MRELFIHGMFRSGTTLLSRMLSAAPGHLFVTDPFVYFFKAYRNYHYTAAGARDWSPSDPTSDHFLSPHHEANQRLLGADLSEELPDELRATMIADIRSWKSEQHSRLCERLDELDGRTFAETYRQLIELCVDLYGDRATEVAGTKASWCDEFLPALGRAFPEMHFALIVRDLRGVVASQKGLTGRGAGQRPLLFYVRHWRKNVAFAAALTELEPTLAGRVHRVHYEDLVRRPEQELRGLCSGSCVEFDPRMVSSERFRSESEAGSWSSNSSFEPGSSLHASSGDSTPRGIFTASIDRWRDVLDADELDFLHATAGRELASLGYEVPDLLPRPLELIERSGEPAPEDLAEWIRDDRAADYLRDPAARLRELAAEELRLDVLEGTQVLSDAWSRRLFPPLGPSRARREVATPCR